jgi:hypothetical protein
VISCNIEVFLFFRYGIASHIVKKGLVSTHLTLSAAGLATGGCLSKILPRKIRVLACFAALATFGERDARTHASSIARIETASASRKITEA